MYQTITAKTIRTISFIVMMSLSVSLIPSNVLAVFGAGDTVVVVGDVSPTSLKRTADSQMQFLKSFTLDRIATMLAKQILHKMTMEVVAWINSGFEGSPAFLTNPEGFFLDAADQVTGAFLATNGPLSSLCSPFAIDLRLSLALSQTALTDKRYECTLGRIIEAQRNGPDITVNGQVIRSSGTASMGGFTGGDFSQGGWQGFLALTTEPQNNAHGAFLSAQSTLYADIGRSQNKISADLQIGSGFLSWESCKDKPNGTNIDLNTEEGINQSKAVTVDANVRQKDNKDGTVTYQTCETQTPGSVIANTLQTNLNVPVVELELADDINAIINALMNQMLMQMFNGGLKALSGGGGGGPSFTQQVINDANDSASAQASLDQMSSSIGPMIDQISANKYKYDQAVNLITASKKQIESAKACFENLQKNSKGDSGVVNEKLTGINNILKNSIDPLLTQLASKQFATAQDLEDVQEINYALASTGSVEQIQIQSQKYTEFMTRGGATVDTRTYIAEQDLADALAQSISLNNQALDYQRECGAQDR